MEQTRAAHARIEGLRHGVGDLDVRLDVARREREELTNRQAQIESDARIAQNEEREADAGGEGLARAWPKSKPNSGCWCRRFAQNPATDEECDDVEALYKTSPTTSSTSCRACAKSWRASRANVNLNAEAERDELVERELFLRSRWKIWRRRARRCWRRSRRSRVRRQAQFNETFEQVSRAFCRDVRAPVPGRRSARCGRPTPRIFRKPASRSRSSRRARSRCRSRHFRAANAR